MGVSRAGLQAAIAVCGIIHEAFDTEGEVMELTWPIILREAADRTAEFDPIYRVEMTWFLAEEGLTLAGRCGADKIEKVVSWDDLEQAQNINELLSRTEQKVLEAMG